MSKQERTVVSFSQNVDRFFDAAKQEQVKNAQEASTKERQVEIKLAGPIVRPF